MKQTDWIDISRMHEISKGDTEFVKAMLTIYLEDFSDYLLQMKEALEQENYELVRYLGHRMKSPAATVRVQKVTGLLDVFESASQEMRHLLLPNYEELSSVHGKVSDEIKSHLKELSATDQG